MGKQATSVQGIGQLDWVTLEAKVRAWWAVPAAYKQPLNKSRLNRPDLPRHEALNKNARRSLQS